MSDEEKDQEETKETPLDESDLRSIYVGNVHYASTTEDLRAVFKECGEIERATIPKDYTGKPKGYAYIEFAEPASVLKAESLNEKELNGRPLRVQPKVDVKESEIHPRRGGYRRGRYSYFQPRRRRYSRYRG